jgi:hypothetical protein
MQFQLKPKKKKKSEDEPKKKKKIVDDTDEDAVVSRKDSIVDVPKTNVRRVCLNCYWWKEHKQCKNTPPDDTCSDFKSRNSTCGTCKDFRKRKMCMNVVEWDTCNQWAPGEKYEICENCKRFDTPKCLEKSTDLKASCDRFKPKLLKPTVEEKYEKKKKEEKETKMTATTEKGSTVIKEMIKQGRSPQQIADRLGIKLLTKDAETPQQASPDAVLKNTLFMALNLLQLAELQYKENPYMKNLQEVNQTISTVQSLVKDLQSYQDPMKFYTQIDEIIVQKATIAYLQALTTEIYELRLKIFDMLPVQKHNIGQKIFGDFFNGVSSNMKAQYMELRRQLARLLGVEAQIEEINEAQQQQQPPRKLTRGEKDVQVGYDSGNDENWS